MHVCVRTVWFDSFATTELTTYLFGSCRRDPPQENGRKRTLMVYPRVVKVSTADNTNSFLPPDVVSKINSTFVRP